VATGTGQVDPSPYLGADEPEIRLTLGRICTLLSTANVITVASALRSNMVSPMVGARIPPELHSQLLEAASRLQVTPSEVIVAALRQYLGRLQTLDNSPTVAGILDRLEQLEQRVEALEAASTTPHPGAAVATGNTTYGSNAGATVATQRAKDFIPLTRTAALPSDLEALPVLELRRLARRVIGPGGDRDPITGKHLRRAELLAALQRELGKLPDAGR